MSSCKASGIYEIRNSGNGKRYVGSAAQFGARWWLHRRDLRENKHHSSALQRAWIKYGEASFEFNVVELCDRAVMYEREQWYFDNTPCDYNCSKVAGYGARLGMKNGENHREAMRKLWADPEYRARKSAASAAAIRTPEWRARLSASLRERNATTPRPPSKRKGAVHTEEAKQKISAAKRGRAWTPAQRAAFESKRDEPKPGWTPERRAKMEAVIASKRAAGVSLVPTAAIAAAAKARRRRARKAA
jgi:group I intron endonuclease